MGTFVGFLAALYVLIYPANLMNPALSMRIGEVTFFFTFLVAMPSVTAAIAYAAWHGKPKNFDRSMFFTAFASAGAASLLMIVYAQRMQADVRTWQYAIQVALFVLGLLLFAVAGGCGLGIFLTKRGSIPKDPCND
jgi:hypothetical protein